MDKQQTALEYFADQLEDFLYEDIKNTNIYKIALEAEKLQIITAHLYGQNYVLKGNDKNEIDYYKYKYSNQ